MFEAFLQKDMMSTVILVVLAILGTLTFIYKIKTNSSKQSKYVYRKKDFLITRAEHEYYDALVKIVGLEYLIFVQVHLPTILEHKIKGQNWFGAFKHISEKSVDFVLCDKNYISPKLVIELDDRSHERQDRQQRDREVERLLKEAKIPLLRIKNMGKCDFNELESKLNTLLTKDPLSANV